MTYEIIIYQSENGKEPFNIRLDSIDIKDQIRVLKRIDRLKLGNFGDSKSVGDYVYELRFTYGGGYRVYYGVKDNKVVILLCGGNKKTQGKDVESAKEFWRDYNANL
ncbi:MAG: type II toxin-antitoxin system RelE/ParE family toxin [Deferribacterales bacterium]